MSVPKVTITFYFPTGFIAGIKGSSSNTAVEVKRFSLVTLRESSAVGAAALGAKCVHYSLPIDFGSMVDEFFRYEFQWRETILPRGFRQQTVERDVEKSVRDTACCLSVGNENISLVSVSSYSSVHIILKCYKFTTYAISGNSFMLRLIWVSTRKNAIKLALTPQKCFWSCFRLKCIWHKLGYPQELSK